MASSWEATVYELLVRASTDLPDDVEAALRAAAESEEPGSSAAVAMQVMLENIELARDKRLPLCQDTGSILFWVNAPVDVRQATFRAAAEAAVVRATAEGILRQNCVDPLTGANTGNGLGRGSPCIHWEQTDAREATVSLLLKGGGCENVGVQYTLPDSALKAGRDLDGVRRCLLGAVQKAQGRGCAPGILGVAVGGDRATGYAESKRQLLRRIGQRSSEPELAALEQRVLAEANQLGVGPMGFGGKTTLLDVFIGALHRLPASYFVSVSYMCWSYRRYALSVSADGSLLRWL